MVCIPTVHWNGTSAQALVEQQQAVLRHLSAARQALAEAGPHGRDYYVQGPDAYRQAAAEHRTRVERLDAICDELMEIALGVQGQERQRRRAA